MVTTIKLTSSAYQNPGRLSFKRNVVDAGGLYCANWHGRATISSTDGSLASVNVRTVAQEKNFIAPSAMVIPANAHILKIGFQTLGPITIDGTATGTLKFATGPTVTTAGLVAESPAAAANVLATMATPAEVSNIATPVSVGGSDATFAIYATTGVDVADTMSVTEDVTIIAQIVFAIAPDFPTLLELGNEAPTVVDSITSY